MDEWCWKNNVQKKHEISVVTPTECQRSHTLFNVQACAR